MKFLVDNEGFAINTAQITAVRTKANKNDGSFKNNRDFPLPFFLEKQERELSQFVKDRGTGT
jgi:hypothetical protein